MTYNCEECKKPTHTVYLVKTKWICVKCKRKKLKERGVTVV